MNPATREVQRMTKKLILIRCIKEGLQQSKEKKRKNHSENLLASFVALWLERSPAKRGRLGMIHSWVIPKTLKSGICCFSCFNAQHLRVAQRMKKQSVDYQ